MTHIGVKGTVKDTSGKPVTDAEVKVLDTSTGNPIDHDILSLQDGDYYRLLADGDYEVTVTAKGYHPTKKCVTVENEMYVGSGIAKEAQVVDFVLTPDTESKPDGGEAAAECELLADGHASQQAVQPDSEGQQEKVLALTEAEERQVLLEVLAYMDNRINWAKLGPQLAQSDLYYTLAMKLSQLDSETRNEFLELLPPQMREHLLMSQQ